MSNLSPSETVIVQVAAMNTAVSKLKREISSMRCNSVALVALDNAS